MDLFSNIPDEMKQFNQWILWKYEDRNTIKPTKIPYSAKGGNASVTKPETWSTFNDCVQMLKDYPHYYSGLGFVLSKDDPYCFIDLDATDNADELAFQGQIYETIESYAELSPSGKGLHIICKAHIKRGKRKGSIEIYDNERYMTMTGNIYRNAHITAQQLNVHSLWAYIGGNDFDPYDLSSRENDDSDQYIIDRAKAAENGELFLDLWEGRWQRHSHKWHDNSQSCADQALINILQFYTKDHKQIIRIFRQSFLGQRDKAKRDGYLLTCIKKAFDRDFPMVDVSAIANQIEKVVSEKNENAISNSALVEKTGLNPFSNLTPENFETHFENVAQIPVEHSVEQLNLNDNHSHSPFSLPPGLLGELASFIHNYAIRPVPEIALASAIGLMAGITGRAYNISGTGLNQYVLVLAQTGTGKEAATRGINALLHEIAKVVPSANEFIGPSVISSSQALIKKLSKHKSFVSIVGEFGSKLQIMTGKNASPSDRGLLIAMLDLFNKSGHGDYFGSMAYSDNDKNIESLKSPAFSLLGESTPDTFYQAIDEKTIQSGFVPRFTVIEYLGDRPNINDMPTKLSDNYSLIDSLAKLCAQCLMLNNEHKVINVQVDEESALILDKYNVFCDEQIRGKDEASRQIWNRAHLKVLKLAALVAVGINSFNPIITKDNVLWAIGIENENIKRILFKFHNGLTGQNSDINEQIQNIELIKVIQQWLFKPFSRLGGFKDCEYLHTLRIVPHKFILIKLQAKKCFKDDKLGSTIAIKRALKSLEESGDILSTRNKELYKTNQLVYTIQNIDTFIE